MNMHETYVSLEVAKLLKEAGFDWECEYLYLSMENISTFESGKIIFAESNINHNLKESEYSAPTLSVAQRWLREIKEMHIVIECVFATKRYFVSLQWRISEGISRTEFIRDAFNTYEEAQEAGIKKCLEMILKAK